MRQCSLLKRGSGKLSEKPTTSLRFVHCPAGRRSTQGSAGFGGPDALDDFDLPSPPITPGRPFRKADACRKPLGRASRRAERCLRPSCRQTKVFEFDFNLKYDGQHVPHPNTTLQDSPLHAARPSIQWRLTVSRSTRLIPQSPQHPHAAFAVLAWICDGRTAPLITLLPNSRAVSEGCTKHQTSTGGRGYRRQFTGYLIWCRAVRQQKRWDGRTLGQQSGSRLKPSFAAFSGRFRPSRSSKKGSIERDRTDGGTTVSQPAGTASAAAGSTRVASDVSICLAWEVLAKTTPTHLSFPPSLVNGLSFRFVPNMRRSPQASGRRTVLWRFRTS